VRQERPFRGEVRGKEASSSQARRAGRDQLTRRWARNTTRLALRRPGSAEILDSCRGPARAQNASRSAWLVLPGGGLSPDAGQSAATHGSSITRADQPDPDELDRVTSVWLDP
jgi:hypothetical protein